MSYLSRDETNEKKKLFAEKKASERVFENNKQTSTPSKHLLSAKNIF